MKEQKQHSQKSKDKASYRSLLKDLSLGALFIALTAAGSLISIPLFPVPLTLQVPIVILSGFILGARGGFFAQLGYILIGLAGLPVFAGGRGGPGTALSPTFGYLLSFPLTAFLVGKLTSNIVKKKFFFTMSIFIVALVPIYLFGTAYLWVFMNFIMDKDMSVMAAVAAGIAPFILWDVIKVVIAALIANRVEVLVRK